MASGASIGMISFATSICCSKVHAYTIKKISEIMSSRIIIRPETPSDHAAISSITESAFRTLEISSNTEHFIVDALRAAGALTISLVAEQEGRVVGHIAFSPITVSDDTTDWYGLGPVSVVPELQRQGIGKALIREGLAQLRTLGAKGCCLVGHPEYYRQFGFTNTPDLSHEGVPPEVFFALAFEGPVPKGTVKFHDAFAVTGPQS